MQFIFVNLIELESDCVSEQLQFQAFLNKIRNEGPNLSGPVACSELPGFSNCHWIYFWNLLSRVFKPLEYAIVVNLRSFRICTFGPFEGLKMDQKWKFWYFTNHVITMSSKKHFWYTYAYPFNHQPTKFILKILP